MRLIDADILLPELELLQDEADAKYHETDFDSFYGGGCSMIQEVIKGVEKQPTAFDVDNVVEQLEKDKFTAECTISEGYGKEDWGAEKDCKYYVLKIHRVFGKKNILTN